MWLNKVIYENRVIENERLELSDRHTLYFLGHNLTLRCTLVLDVPAKRLHVNETRIMECTIEARKLLKNFQWDAAHVKGCRFKGRFTGNDFGGWPDRRAEASIEDCDFSEAHLDATRFLSCDPRTLRWPEAVGRLEIECLAEAPPTTVAVTYSALELAKRRGTTPEAIKAVLEELDGVSY